MAEFFYVFYLLSGLFDGFLAVNGISIGIDLGVVASLALLLILIYNLLFWTKIKLPINFVDSFIILMIIFGFGIISLIYTPSSHYAYIKLLYFFKEIVLTFSFPFLVKNFNIKRFIKWLAVLTFAYTVIYLYYANIKLPYSHDRVYKSFISQYLYIGITNGVVFLLMIFSRAKIYKNDLWQFSFAILALAFLIASAARGPAIFLAIVLLLSFLKTFYVKIKRKWVFLIVILLLVIIPVFIHLLLTDPKFVSFLNTMLHRTIKRFSKLIAFFTGHGQDLSAEERVSMLQFTIHGIFDNIKHFLIGHGIGSFGILYLGKDIRWYPHNIFLEIWYEIGFIPFLLMVVLFLKAIIMRRQNPYVSVFVVLYILFNILKSYSFADMRVAYMFLALYMFPGWGQAQREGAVPDPEATPDTR